VSAHFVPRWGRATDYVSVDSEAAECGCGEVGHLCAVPYPRGPGSSWFRTGDDARLLHAIVHRRRDSHGYVSHWYSYRRRRNHTERDRVHGMVKRWPALVSTAHATVPSQHEELVNRSAVDLHTPVQAGHRCISFRR
jgi:hypothetical protein